MSTNIGINSADGSRRGQMPSWLPYSVALALPLLLTVACTKQISVVAPTAASDPRIQEYLAKGEEYFQHQNLYGWRMAEAFYARAHALRGDTELTDKLLLTRVLRITRESDEDIASGTLAKTLASDCASLANARQQSLCDFALRYIAPRAPRAQGRDAETVSIPHLADMSPQSEDLDAYLQVLYSQAYGFELANNFRESASGKFKSSSLFQYLNLRKGTAQPSIEMEKSFPDFAELYVVLGEKRMQDKRYRESRVYFNRALALIPDYTRAINGLGNIYLYVLEDYPEALQRYELAMRFDPTNSGALYGKGAVLHSTGRFDESNQVFDQMIASDISRGGRFDVRFYRGMGRYYQAYNYYRLSEPKEARKHIDLGKQDLPNAEQINYLSGVFYFNENQMDLARVDFEKLNASGSSNCEAYYYLGQIYLQTDEDKALNSFLRMCSCVESAIDHTKREIATLPSLDVEPAELNRLKTKLEDRLSNFCISSADMIKNAIKLVDLTNTQRKDTYKELMEGTLQRLIPVN